MNRAVGVSRGSTDHVGFRSLVDLFELNEAKSQHKLSELQSRLDIPNIDHHVETRLTVEAELCRQILMAGCQPQESAVRAQIKSQNAAILALYRGFSRFMLEDLELHPFTQKMTRSQRKKLSTKVAFEMIMVRYTCTNEILRHVRFRPRMRTLTCGVEEPIIFQSCRIAPPQLRPPFYSCVSTALYAINVMLAVETNV